MLTPRPVPPLPSREQSRSGDPQQVQSCLRILKQVHGDEAGRVQAKKSVCNSESFQGMARQGRGEMASLRIGWDVLPLVDLPCQVSWPGWARLGKAEN